MKFVFDIMCVGISSSQKRDSERKIERDRESFRDKE
jgi:hypothetical protein